MITVTCPNCHETLQVPEQYAGQRGTCKKCNGPLLVPSLGAASTSLDLPDDLAAALNASLSAERPRPVVVPDTIGDKLGRLVKPAGMALGIVAAAALILGAIAYLPKLGLGGGPGPAEVTGSFLQAFNSGTIAQCQPYMTAKAYQNVSGMPAGAMQRMDQYTVGAAAITGDNAQVPVQVTQFGITVSQDVLLRKESGDWRVYGIRVAPMPGMSMTMDFENPEAMMEEAKKMMEGLPPEVMKGFDDAMRQQMAQ